MLLAATDPQLGLKCSEGRSLLPKMTESINSHLKSSNLDSFERTWFIIAPVWLILSTESKCMNMKLIFCMHIRGHYMSLGTPIGN